MGSAAKTALEVSTAAVVAGIKAAYRKSVHNEKNLFFTFFEQMFEGIWELGTDIVNGIKNLVKNTDTSANDEDALEKNQTFATSSGTTFTSDSENVMTVTDNSGNSKIYNLYELIKTLNVNGSKEVYDYSNGVTIIGDGNGNTIYNYGNDITIECNGGNDTVYNMGDNVSIKGAKGANQIYSAGANVKVIDLADDGNTIELGEGDDTVKVADKGETDTETRYRNTIDAGDGNNYIYNSNVELSTILSGSGNDTIITGGGY